ncbi:MAG: phosphatase PAP2 family protein [Coriobacteriales bacterium]|jgi:membrane-associated phospholipid phosphatase|nr:phosphatase PAP2 family protein [Coriobacteriales bacterium]
MKTGSGSTLIADIGLLLLLLTLAALVIYRFASRRLATRDDRRAFTSRYLFWPMIITAVMFVGQLLCYGGTRLLTENVPHHNFGTALDAAIPLIPFFIIFYLMAYLVVIFAPFYLAWIGGTALTKKYFVSLVALFSISALIYLVAPNDVPHAWTPDVYAQHTGFFDRLLQFVYDADAPSNGLPSLHNAHIWLIFFIILFNDTSPRRIMHLLPVGVLGVLISLSTLFCKEHYLVDVLFSISLVALLAFIARRLFERLSHREGLRHFSSQQRSGHATGDRGVEESNAPVPVSNDSKKPPKPTL